MLEWYEAYADYNDIADELEELVEHVAATVSHDTSINWARPWKRITLRDAILEETGVDIYEHRDKEALLSAAEAEGKPLDPNENWPKLVDSLLSKYVEPKLTDPTLLMDYPVELSPFAKRHRSEPGLVERFEAFAGGMEFSNAFTELNDPDDQRARFEAQTRDREGGDAETQPYDEDYIFALEHGMPPTGGIGIGIDRLAMLLGGRDSIREVQLFPAMR
jgi:lysyl-tRNA synthetase class 2